MKSLLPITNLVLLKNSNKFVVNNQSGSLFFYCPHYFFVSNCSKGPHSLKLLFRSKESVKTFLKHLFFLVKCLNKVFFVKLKVRGLGYRFKRISSNLYRFYFTRTNYIYLHRPKDVIIKSRKRRIILLSYNVQQLHMIFNHLLLLHKVGPYNRRGFTYPRRIIKLKPGKKII